MRRVLACAALAAMAAAGDARADAPVQVQAPGGEAEAPIVPVREGLTVELDASPVGITRVDDAISGPATSYSIPGLDVSVGWFGTPDVAVMFRFTAQTFWMSRDTTTMIQEHAFAGPALEVWIDDRVSASLGAGLGLEGGQAQDGSSSDVALGVGVTARVSYAPWIYPDTAWRFSLEATYGSLENQRQAYSAALLLGWQSY